MSKVIDAVFPYVAYCKANKTLRKILLDEPKGVLCFNENADAISTDVLKDQYAETMRIKDKLEDKAKTNVVGLTITITLILGATGMLTTIYEKYSYPTFSWIAFILFTLAVIYMFLAGIIAIKVLIDENKIFVINLSSFAADETVLREDYDKCISQNRTQNIIRNNGVFTSYKCIRNSLICLFLVLVLSSVPYVTADHDIADLEYTNAYKNYSFVYASSAINGVSEYADQLTAENDILQAIDSGMLDKSKATPISIVDQGNKLFIKFGVEDNVITVFLVEPYTTP